MVKLKDVPSNTNRFLKNEIYSDRISASFFLPETLIGIVYLDLENTVVPIVTEVKEKDDLYIDDS